MARLVVVAVVRSIILAWRLDYAEKTGTVLLHSVVNIHGRRAGGEEEMIDGPVCGATFAKCQTPQSRNREGLAIGQIQSAD